MVQIKEIENYANYGKCIAVTNGVIEAYVTVEKGPNIVRFGYVEKQNILSDSNFGHKMVLATNNTNRISSTADNVTYKATANGAKFMPITGEENNFYESLEIKMDADDTNLQIVMRAKNIDSASKNVAICSTTALNEDGTVIAPMNTNETGNLPNKMICVWQNTDLSDERLYLGKSYMIVKQEKTAASQIKLGMDQDSGTAYYLLNKDIFSIKFNTNLPSGNYPDNGCTIELAVDKACAQITTFSDFRTLRAGETIEHIESWSLFKKPCEVEFNNDTSIDNLLKRI